MDVSSLPLVRPLDGAPERAFGGSGIHRAGDGSLVATQDLGPASRDAADRPQVAGLGVLVDDVLGYALIEAAPEWSVSTEIGIDVLAGLPQDGRVHCTARTVHVDGAGALVAGSVRDEAGAELARCLLRGRFVPGGPAAGADTTPGAAADPGPPARSIGDVLGVPDPADPADWAAGVPVTVTEALVNPVGTLHGGMHLALLERVGALTVPTPGRTGSVRAQIVRPAPLGARLTIGAEVEHPGRTLGVVRVVARDATGRAVSLATVVRH